MCFCLAWFWLGLAPTLWVRHWRADRHLYLPAIGLFVLAGIAVARWLGAATGRRRVLDGLLLALILGAMIVLARGQAAA